MLTEIRNSLGGPEDQALAQCQAAIAVLEAEGDLEGLAEAWKLTGMYRFWLGDSPADQQALERAMAYARQGGHRRVQMQASFWLALTFITLPIPVDAAIPRAEQLLQTADGEPWAEADILGPLSELYAYGGRFADARRAIARARSVYDSSGSKIRWALGEFVDGEIELLAGDLAAAEQHLRKAYEAYRANGRDTKGRKLGRRPKPWVAPELPEGEVSVTDPDTHVMKANVGYVQGYNAQAVVDEGQIVIAAEITNSPADYSQLDPMLTAAIGELERAGVEGRPGVALADAQYWNEEHMDEVIANKHIQVLIPPDSAGRSAPRPGWTGDGIHGCAPSWHQHTASSCIEDGSR